MALTSASQKVAVVTGANRGIGLGVVRALCKKFKGDVILTSRDLERGKIAMNYLEFENLRPKYHQLDIDDAESISQLTSYIAKHYGTLNVLVNNAAIQYKQDSEVPFAEQAEKTVITNFFSTLDVCDKMFPILAPFARVANVSSLASQWCLKHLSCELQDRFTDPKIQMDDLKELMVQYVILAREGKHQEAGWPHPTKKDPPSSYIAKSPYGVSKMGVTVMSFIQQKQMDLQAKLDSIDDKKKNKKVDIVINACCPGFIATGMTDYHGTKNIDQGAECPLYLATILPNARAPRGEFLSEKTIQTWGKGDLPDPKIGSKHDSPVFDYK